MSRDNYSVLDDGAAAKNHKRGSEPQNASFICLNVFVTSGAEHEGTMPKTAAVLLGRCVAVCRGGKTELRKHSFTTAGV